MSKCSAGGCSCECGGGKGCGCIASSNHPLNCDCWCFGSKAGNNWTFKQTEKVDVTISGLPLYEVARFLDSVCSKRVLIPADMADKRIRLKFKRKPFGAVLKHLGLTASREGKKKSRKAGPVRKGRVRNVARARS